MGRYCTTLDNSIAPSFINLFLVTDNDSSAGVPFSPLAISVIPRIPKPQFDIKNVFKLEACSKKCNKALAPLGPTALLLIFK